MLFRSLREARQQSNWLTGRQIGRGACCLCALGGFYFKLSRREGNTRAQVRFRLFHCPPIFPNGNLAQAAPGRNIPLCQNQMRLLKNSLGWFQTFCAEPRINSLGDVAKDKIGVSRTFSTISNPSCTPAVQLPERAFLRTTLEGSCLAVCSRGV